MNDNLIREGNFITIQSFMVTDLNLKGNELIVYAIIYGFSQTTGQNFTGSLKYLEAWTSLSKQGIINVLKSLVEKGLIGKIESIKNGVKFCEYYANYTSGEETLPVVKKVDRGGKKSLPNNIDNNIDNIYIKENIKENDFFEDEQITLFEQEPIKQESKIPTEKDLREEFEILWKLYPRKAGKPNALAKYIKYRTLPKSNINYTTFEQVKEGIENYNKQIKKNKTDLGYIKHASTWFNQQCWKDDYDTGEKQDSRITLTKDKRIEILEAMDIFRETIGVRQNQINEINNELDMLDDEPTFQTQQRRTALEWKKDNFSKDIEEYKNQLSDLENSINNIGNQ